MGRTSKTNYVAETVLAQLSELAGQGSRNCIEFFGRLGIIGIDWYSLDG